MSYGADLCARMSACYCLPQAELLADKRIVVAMDAWDTDSAYPAGHYVRTLGAIGDRCAPPLHARPLAISVRVTAACLLRTLVRCSQGLLRK